MSDYSDLSGFSKIINGRKLYYVTKMLKKTGLKLGAMESLEPTITYSRAFHKTKIDKIIIL